MTNFHQSVLTARLYSVVALGLLWNGEMVFGTDSPHPAPVPAALKSGTIEGEKFGEIEFFPIILEPTDDYISLSEDLVNWKTGTVWGLDADTPEKVAAILSAAGLDSEHASRLSTAPFLTRNNEDNFYEIRPDEETIINLSAEQRASLYPLLLPKSPINPFHEPFALGPGGVAGKTRVDPSIFPGAVSLIDQMSFRQGQAVRFSDIRYVLGKAGSDEERRKIVKLLMREESLTVRLRLSDQCDVTVLENYWSAGGRNKEILPVLDSVISTPGVDVLDIVHLLPPTPRKLLHTFPSPGGEGHGADLPDCFWTSFSFFGDDPPDRYFDLVDHVRNERYETAEKPYQLGDLVTIFDDRNQKALHACNLLAGDLVFTKNGVSMGRAWTISKLDRILDTYRRSGSIRITFSRLKPEFQK